MKKSVPGIPTCVVVLHEESRKKNFHEL